MNKLTLFLGLFLLFACGETTQKAEEQAPNIVLLFTDDQTYHAVNALGNSAIETPNMDRLAQNGTTFTHAYNMGAWNGAVCLASRAMMISGRSVWNAHQFRKRWVQGDSIAMTQTWGKLMEQQGYDTYMTGKWHVDAPADQVFQTAKHIRPGMPNDAWEHHEMVRKFAEEVDGINIKAEDIMPVGYNRPKDENDNSWSPSDPQFGGFWEGGKHWSEVVRDDALEFIQTAKTKDNPFFMYIAFNAPHDPRQAPQEFIDRYPIEEIKLPESWMPEYPYQNSIGNGPRLRDEALAPFPRTEYATKKHIQEYYAIVTHLDEQIGKILDELEASGKMDNTYIFFTADHGLAIGRHGLLGKQNLFDHSVRVPMMMVGKDIPKGKKVSSDVYLQDVMATSLELANIEKPDYVEFNSFLDLAKGNVQSSPYDGIYGAYVNLQRSIRKDGFKLIIYPKIDKILLFDLANDPEEMNDLSEDAAHQERVASLFRDLMEMQEEKGDGLELGDLYEQLAL
ncbi:MAG: sulfatase-like hydrolase/transferase [Bacteroidota bacterium]